MALVEEINTIWRGEISVTQQESNRSKNERRFGGMKSIAAKIIACIGGIVLAAMAIVCIVTSTMASRNMYASEDKIVQLSNETSVSCVTNYLQRYVSTIQQMACLLYTSRCV